MPFLIDTHCHLHFPPFAGDLEAVLQHMREKQIFGITIGTALGNSEAGIKFAEQHEGIWATVGLHPEHVTSSFEDENEGAAPESDLDIARLETLARSSAKVVAIGETGLDYFRIDADRDQVQSRLDQRRVFLAHLEVAECVHLPVVVHCREALSELAEILRERKNAGHEDRCVIHSFTGSWEEAIPLIELGCMIALNGIATFPPRKNADPQKSLERVICEIPLESLLLETDAPYLAPNPYRGKRNEPAYVEEVAKHIALKRGISVEEIAEATTKNAQRVFGLTW